MYLSYMNDVVKELEEFQKWAEPILKRCDFGAKKLRCGTYSNGKRRLMSGSTDLRPVRVKNEPGQSNEAQYTSLPVREVQDGEWKIRGKDGNPIGQLELITWKYE